jgi:hypothetical protein
LTQTRHKQHNDISLKRVTLLFQIDLRDDATTVEKLAKNKQKPLSLEMGEKLAKELRAVKYVECSALTQV